MDGPIGTMDWHTTSMADSVFSSKGHSDSFNPTPSASDCRWSNFGDDSASGQFPELSGSTLSPKQLQGFLGLHDFEESPASTRNLEKVIDLICELGFEGPESVVSEFHTRDLTASPRLASMRHLSRNRRLPEMLSGLRDSAESWTEWEGQGYRAETLKSAENVLSNEREGLAEDGRLENLLDSFPGGSVSILPSQMNDACNVFGTKVSSSRLLPIDVSRK